MKILVVENEILIQMLVVQYLEEAGFATETAENAAQALDKLGAAAGNVDAIVLDVGLPDQNGDILTKEIRASYPALPIVLATGHWRNEFEALLEPGLTFLSKPYSANSLVRALRDIGVTP